MHRIVIVGGGIAGLAAAWELARHDDVAITVVEASDRVGGKLRQEVVAGHLVDVGAEAILRVRPEALTLIAEIGAGAEQVSPATTSASVRSHGALHPLPRGTLMGIPADPRSAAGILDGPEVERACAERPGAPVSGDVSVGEFVAGRLGDAVVDRLVEPLLGGVYAGHARRLSLAATVPALYAAARAGTSVLAAAGEAAGRAGRRREGAGPVNGHAAGLGSSHGHAVRGIGPVAGGSGPQTGPGRLAPPEEPAAPAEGTPAPLAEAAEPTQPFVGIRGGVGRLPGLLVEALRDKGVEIRLGLTVRDLVATPGGGWTLIAGPTTDVVLLAADAVILAVPAPAARRLLGVVAPVASAELAGIEMASMAVVTFAFAAAAVPPLPGSGFLVPPAEGLAIKAATFSSAKWPWLRDLAPGVTYLRASIGRHGEEAAVQHSDAEVAAVALADLRAVAGDGLPEPLDVHVQRWGGALPQYAVGHLDRVAGIAQAVADVPGLALAGAAYDGVGIPAVIGSGRRAGAAISEHLTAKGHLHV